MFRKKSWSRFPCKALPFYLRAWARQVHTLLFQVPGPLICRMCLYYMKRVRCKLLIYNDKFTFTRTLIFISHFKARRYWLWLVRLFSLVLRYGFLFQCSSRRPPMAFPISSNVRALFQSFWMWKKNPLFCLCPGIVLMKMLKSSFLWSSQLWGDHRRWFTSHAFSISISKNIFFNLSHIHLRNWLL